jgi:hypothetical protein
MECAPGGQAYCYRDLAKSKAAAADLAGAKGYLSEAANFLCLMDRANEGKGASLWPAGYLYILDAPGCLDSDITRIAA